MVCLLWAVQNCLSRDAKKIEDPHKYIQALSISPGTKEKLVKKQKDCTNYCVLSYTGTKMMFSAFLHV